MDKITKVIRGNEGFIDALILSTINKSKHLPNNEIYNVKMKHKTESNVFCAVYDVYEDGESEIWDLIKNDVMNPNHFDKLELYIDEWNNTEE